MDYDAILDKLDVAVKSYGAKELAFEINKGYSTLRNELNPNLQDQYKLGLQAAILIMKKTGDLAALDHIEGLFGRVAFLLPEADPGNIHPLMTVVSRMTKEFGETLASFSQAMEDGKITKKEAKAVAQEVSDLVHECMLLKSSLEKISK